MQAIPVVELFFLKFANFYACYIFAKD